MGVIIADPAGLVTDAAIPARAGLLVPPEATAGDLGGPAGRRAGCPRLRSRALPSLARPAGKFVVRARRIYKRGVKASPLIGLIIALPIAAWADPWCGQWKTQQMCASPEDFQTFANRICLQAQARENPTVDESISLHTDCQAAKTLAHQAELAKTRHDQATSAQKELDAMRR